MKFTEKWKRFWTLNRHHAEGFTLVELIVVIAIIAVLGTVAVPAYSGYVTKANKQADISLISEIEHALTLAGYKGTFANGEGGYLILSADGEVQGVAADSNLEKALIDTFGAGYKNVMKLKYDAWGNSGLLKYLSVGAAEYINQSSYMNRQDRLMGDVETITNVVDLISNLDKNDDELETGVTTRRALIDMFSITDAEGNVKNSLLDATNDYYGLDLKSPDELYAWSNNKGTDLSNLMVFAVANEMDNKTQGMMNGEDTELSAAVGYVSDFSHFYAYAAQDDEFAKTLDDYLAFLNDPTSVELTNYQGNQMAAVEGYGSGAMWYRSLMEAAGKSEGYKAYHEDNLDGTDYAEGSQPANDKLAFQFMMSTMGNPDEAQKAGIASALGDANLFTEGLGGQAYKDFMDAVDVITSLGTDAELPNVPAGSIGVLYVLSDNGIAVMDTTPKT